jgi:phage terminase large subunit-like protein
MYGLPYLYGWKFYKWAREFFESRNKLNFLCAANQISKSSTQIRKCIHWATDQPIWPQLWARRPTQFWYLYPSQEVVNAEFKLKWVQFLPRGRFKDDPYYGWKELKSTGNTVGIEFNSGVIVYFKTYTKSVQHLQTGTCDSIFCDEELPVEIYDELAMRLNATDGYFHMVFTATMGQDLWRRCMEHAHNEKEAFPTAAKWTVSLYEAMFYDDGTASHWTEERINGVINKCKNNAEVQKRVYGRFVMDEGLLYPTFDIGKHVIKGAEIPSSWLIYAGIDVGSGGEKGHPAAITFVAVRPDYRSARVFMGWRGDDTETTVSDVVLKYIEMKKGLTIAAAYYDWASKDFEIVARRMGEGFLKAEKSHEKGEQVINALFKNDMIFIYDHPELSKLSGELMTLYHGQDKRKAKNDFTDSFRYSVSSIPFDFEGLIGVPDKILETPEQPLTEVMMRRKAFEDNDSDKYDIQEEFDEWNDRYG